MRKIFYLSSCDTCQRILNELKVLDDFLLQDVKNEPITEQQLDELKEIVGRYELLFNKRAKLYRERELHKQSLTEENYKKLILEHYTFKTTYFGDRPTYNIWQCNKNNKRSS